MKDYEINVLERYDMHVNSTRKIRGAVLCDTNQGWYILKEATLSEKRVPVLCELLNKLENNCGFAVDSMIKNKEGNWITTIENDEKYIVKKWFQGRDCDVRKESDVMESARNLARLHLCMQEMLDMEDFSLVNLENEYLRHNRELKKVRTFIRDKVKKGDFETAFLQCFEQMYEIAEQVYVQFTSSDYKELYKQALLHRTITHGEYNYHNVLMLQQNIATTNFEHFCMDIQLSDLYYYLRKLMEKYEWNETIGGRVLDAYSSIKTLNKAEMEYLALRLGYPEKFWKIANTYYRSNKAWIPSKNVEKLQIAIVQTQKKQRFLKNIFTFHL